MTDQTTTETPTGLTTTVPAPVLATSSFFVGGRYVDTDEGQAMFGQCFVRRYSDPSVPRQKLPVVFIHGGGGSLQDFEQTPDGRPGWGVLFAQAGFDVFLLDQAGRGRSPRVSRTTGGTGRDTAEVVRLVTRPEDHGMWRTASEHDQWPGSGLPGDPAFDQFFAGHPIERFSAAEREEAMAATRLAVQELLQKIGPAIVLTHSQGGELGWLAVDDSPELIPAMIAVEPAGPPFVDPTYAPAPKYQVDDRLLRTWGLSRYPLTYDPPVADPATDLPFERQAEPEREGLMACHLQAGDPKKLARFLNTEILVVTGSASRQTAFDHCTVRYLQQAGVNASHLRLEDVGIRGNSHVLVMEENNAEIADAMLAWLRERGFAE